jgi:hypothetical protein
MELLLENTASRLARYMSFYNTAKPHQAHGGRPPDSAYFATLAAIPRAARSEATMPAP